MVSKAEEFVLDVRRAARLEQRPTFATDSQLVDPDTAAKALQRAAMWLTPKAVATYDPAAFSPWPSDLQQELRGAVESFRSVAATIPPDKPAKGQQFRDGLQAFRRLSSAVQRGVWADWKEDANCLIKQVEDWAAELKWVTRRVDKKLNEMLLGEYHLDQLYLHAEGNLYILDPIARFVPGALGAFDLSIQPSFYVTSIYHHMDGVWYIHLDVRQGVHGVRKEPLTRDTFTRAVAELRSML
jgi:phytoene dehydrogenase-like protein